jgi:hypothetical protein
VQLDPMKPKFKPPGTKRLKLKCDILLSTSAFKFNLRRYTEGAWTKPVMIPITPSGFAVWGPVWHLDDAVGWCKLTR